MDGVNANDFARQMKSKHLFLALVIDYIALKTAGSHGGDGLKFVTGAKEVLSGLDRPGAVHNLLETLGFVSGQTAWQAQVSQGASAAGYLSTAGMTVEIVNIVSSLYAFHHRLSINAPWVHYIFHTLLIHA